MGWKSLRIPDNGTVCAIVTLSKPSNVIFYMRRCGLRFGLDDPGSMAEELREGRTK